MGRFGPLSQQPGRGGDEGSGSELGRAQRAIEALGQQFRTKDVSNHPDVTRAHQRFLAEFNYHAAIGKALSNNRQALGVELVSTAGGNARWAKAAGSSQAQAGEPVGSVMLASDIGPQSAVTRRSRRGCGCTRAGTGPPCSAFRAEPVPCPPARPTTATCSMKPRGGRAELPHATDLLGRACAHRARRRRRAVPVPAQHAQQPADVLQPVRSARR